MKSKTGLLVPCLAMLLLSVVISGCAGKEADTGTVDAKTELKEILGIKNTLEYKVTYTLNSAEFKSTPMTKYVKGNILRIDSTLNGVDSQAYIKGFAIYSCTKAPEGWMCFEFETTEDLKEQMDYMPMDHLDENLEAYNVQRLGKRTIAGVSARCYKSESTQDSSYFETCYSPDNIPLYMKTVSIEPGAGTREMTATSYSTSVSDTVFELPAEPIYMTNIIKGMTSEDPCGLCDMIPEESRQQCLADCNSA